jgi:DNA-binding response OmpR family regulator
VRRELRGGAPLGNILVADDDPEWLGLIRNWLEGAGYRAFPTPDGGKVLEMAAMIKPDCIVLDYHLRDMTAADVCLKLQAEEATKRIPVIVLTADNDQELAAINQGADHFVAKTGEADIFLANLRACLRRRALDSDILVKGDLKLDPLNCAVIHNGKILCRLSREQFAFLHLLVRSSPRAVSRADAGLAVLGRENLSGTSKALNQLASRIREHLGPQLSARLRSGKGFGWLYDPAAPASR